MLNEHLYVVILEPDANFWAGQEVSGAGKKMFGLKNLPNGG